MNIYASTKSFNPDATLPKAGAANPAAHPMLQKLMGGGYGGEVTKLHLSWEMVPQVSYMIDRLVVLGYILSGV